MRTFTDAHRDWLTVVRLPAYAPDLNPAEGVWANMKSGLGNLAARDVGQLAAIVKNRLKRIQYRLALLVTAGIWPLFRDGYDGWLSGVDGLPRSSGRPATSWQGWQRGRRPRRPACTAWTRCRRTGKAGARKCQVGTIRCRLVGSYYD
jgi:hypothetical protein